jgi:hypothetical protein
MLHAGVVFVIDCDDKERITLAKEELLNLSEKLGRSSSIPIVIAANKQDLSSLWENIFSVYYFIFLNSLEPLRKEDLILALALPKIKSDEWKIFEISALTGKSSIQRRKKNTFRIFVFI